MNSSDPQAVAAAPDALQPAPAPLCDRRAPSGASARALSRRQGGAPGAFLATRPTARAALAPAARPGERRRRRRCASSGATPACRPTSRWSRSAATAAASCSPIPTSTCWCCCPSGRRRRPRRRDSAHRALHRQLLGPGPRDRLQRAHGRRVRGDGADDVTVQTALLESRHLSGARKLFTAFQQRFARGDGPASAFLAPRRWRCASATRSTRTRPTRSSRTARRARAACATCSVICGWRSAAGFGRSWHELAAHGLITPFEVRQIKRNEGCSA